MRRVPEPQGSPAPPPCEALRVVIATALYDRLPPPDATPADVGATERLNAELAAVRTRIEEACSG